MCKWHSFDPYSGVVYVWVLALLLCKKERHRRFYRACGKSNEVQNCPCTIVHETARVHARTHAQCTYTLCITQLHNVHKVEDGACGNKAQAVDPIEQRHTGTRSHWAELGKSQLHLYTPAHIVEDPIEETWEITPCVRESPTVRQKQARKQVDLAI